MTRAHLKPVRIKRVQIKNELLIIALLMASMFLQTANAEVDAARQNELLYFIKHDCGSCHGMTLKGGLGPALLPDSALVLSGISFLLPAEQNSSLRRLERRSR